MEVLHYPSLDGNCGSIHYDSVADLTIMVTDPSDDKVLAIINVGEAIRSELSGRTNVYTGLFNASETEKAAWLHKAKVLRGYADLIESAMAVTTPAEDDHE